jgi:membrane-bound lytic murein transglycosylase D
MIFHIGVALFMTAVPVAASSAPTDQELVAIQGSSVDEPDSAEGGPSAQEAAQDSGLEPSETEEAYGSFETLEAVPQAAPSFDGTAASLFAPDPAWPSRLAGALTLPGTPLNGKSEEVENELASFYNVPIVRNASVDGHIRFFGVAIRDRFEHWLARLAHYRPVVEKIFAEFNLPSDLIYLSLVESGFNPHAYSRARATGPWQFMKGTAKVYGLRVDRYVDERRDPIKSTIAAARYLRDLYDLFGTWPLAMAAYNAGEGKVMRALERTQAANFWDIARTKHLRRETKEYVPRFMAATIIARNPDQYGFASAETTQHEFEEVLIPRSVHLRSVAQATGIAFEELRRLNPELRMDATPPGETAYHLKVPVGTQEDVLKVLDRIPTWKPTIMLVHTAKVSKNTRLSQAEWYRVRVGDTLRSIARRFHITVAELRAWNKSTTRGIKPGDLLAIAAR